MSLSHTLLHAASLVRSDVRRGTRDLWPTRTAVGEDDIVVVEGEGFSGCRKYQGDSTD